VSAERAVYDHAAYAAVESIASAFDLDAVTLASSPALPHLLAEALRLMPGAMLVERLRTTGSLAGAVDPYAVVVSRLRSLARHAAALGAPRPVVTSSAEPPSAEPRGRFFLQGTGWIK
jgi:hypothetical protein